jgi:hypothetical protein
MVGTRKPGKGQNMEFNETEMYRNPIFLDETGCIMNEKMMPDLTIMVPELEIVKNSLTFNISMHKCARTRNFQILHSQTLQFLICF